MDKIAVTPGTGLVCRGLGDGVGAAYVEAKLLAGSGTGSTAPAAVSIRALEPVEHAAHQPQRAVHRRQRGVADRFQGSHQRHLDPLHDPHRLGLPVGHRQRYPVLPASVGQLPSSQALTVGPQQLPGEQAAATTGVSSTSTLACTIWFTLELQSPQLLSTMSGYGLPTNGYTPHISLAKKKWQRSEVGAPSGTAVGKPDPATTPDCWPAANLASTRSTPTRNGTCRAGRGRVVARRVMRLITRIAAGALTVSVATALAGCGGSTAGSDDASVVANAAGAPTPGTSGPPTTTAPTGEVVAVQPADQGAAVLSAIGSATSSVDVVIYQIGGNEIGQALLNAMKRGVKVRLMMDGYSASQVGTTASSRRRCSRRWPPRVCPRSADVALVERQLQHHAPEVGDDRCRRWQRRAAACGFAPADGTAVGLDRQLPGLRVDALLRGA